MEKKTIGQFIAALRKASGMTQKQLSEKLNVSDKAVSRWERDECAPDLSLIPVIAEIFGVTSDEILRGERKFGETDISEYPVTSAKSTKQIERILNDAKLKFSIRSIISVGIAIVGLLGAMLCNFGFNRAHIGFIVACVLYLAAAVCETIFVKLAFASVSGDELENEKTELCKKDFYNTAILSYFVFFHREYRWGPYELQHCTVARYEDDVQSGQLCHAVPIAFRQQALLRVRKSITVQDRNCVQLDREYRQTYHLKERFF